MICSCRNLVTVCQSLLTLTPVQFPQWTRCGTCPQTTYYNPKNRAQMLLDDEHRRKQARLLQSDKYRLTKHILSTSNIVERLLRLALTDHRKIITPRHLELLMFLRTNRSSL
jgi:hypothetical protein